MNLLFVWINNMPIWLRGTYPPISSKSLIEYLDFRIKDIDIMLLKAKESNDELKVLLCEGAKIALENTKEDILYSIEK